MRAGSRACACTRTHTRSRTHTHARARARTRSVGCARIDRPTPDKPFSPGTPPPTALTHSRKGKPAGLSRIDYARNVTPAALAADLGIQRRPTPLTELRRAGVHTRVRDGMRPRDAAGEAWPVRRACMPLGARTRGCERAAGTHSLAHKHVGVRVACASPAVVALPTQCRHNPSNVSDSNASSQSSEPISISGNHCEDR